MDLQALLQLGGFGGIALIKQIIDKISTNKTSGLVKVIYSLILGIAVNMALIPISHVDWKVALVVGLLTAIASNAYNDSKVA